MKQDLRKFSTDKILISPSLLAADFRKLGSEIDEVYRGGALEIGKLKVVHDVTPWDILGIRG